MPESPALDEPVEIETPPLRLPDSVATEMLPLCSALPLVIVTEPPSLELVEPAVTATEPEPDDDEPTDTDTPPALDALASPVESTMAPEPASPDAFVVVAEMSPPLDNVMRPLLPLDTDTSEPDATDTEPPTPDWDLPAANWMEPLFEDPESPVDTLTEPLILLVLAPLDRDTEPLPWAPLALAMATLPLETTPLPLISCTLPPLALADDPPDTTMSAPSPEPDTPIDSFRAPADPPLLSPVLKVTPPLAPLEALPVDKKMLPLPAPAAAVARLKLPLLDAPAPELI